NVDRLIRIMNQIFDFRKIELDKLDIRVSKSGIVGFTKGMLEFFDYQIKQKYIHISTDFPDEEIEFYFDRDKMDQIIFNLLSNAIKNCPDHGEITLEIRKSVISNRKNDAIPILQWIIKDNGPGIPEEKISNLFDRFSYTDSSVNSQGGTGIGLSIVQEFMKLHHGSVSIKSKARKDGYENSWTMVSLEFPLRDELYTDDQKTVDDTENKLTTSEYKPEVLSDSVSFTGNYHSDENFSLSENAYTALVIDDDKDICRLLKTELSVNYRVYAACNGMEGIQMAEKYMPDIIISDIMMPEIDGFELCKTLKTKVETSHIPIILLTGKSADEDEIKGYSTGADAFISKPFDLEKLLNRIDTLITSRLQLKRSFLSSYGIELKKVVPSNTDEKFIQKFLKIINDNISDHSLNVDKITREIGMSRSMLYKKLNSITNTSVNIFIRKIRLQRATELLTKGEMSITEVAYAVGFDSLPYFSKCFQEEFGVSPSKYNSEVST
ncbi:MAG: hybrid sensor histidine kinase/response regulator transcription factor, partial [Bacteroidales bacterium]